MCLEVKLFLIDFFFLFFSFKKHTSKIFATLFSELRSKAAESPLPLRCDHGTGLTGAASVPAWRGLRGPVGCFGVEIWKENHSRRVLLLIKAASFAQLDEFMPLKDERWFFLRCLIETKLDFSERSGGSEKAGEDESRCCAASLWGETK